MGQPTRQYSGTVADVVVCPYEGREVCLKLLRADSGVEQDAEAALTASEYVRIISPSAADTAQALCDTLLDELDLPRERRMARLVRAAGILPVPDEVPELCSDQCYAYEHTDGTALSLLPRPLDPRIPRHICLCFFELLHCKGLLLADVNPGNFVLGLDSSLTAIDFGCVIELDLTIREMMRRVHLSRDSAVELGKALGSTALGEAVADLSRPFWTDGAPLVPPERIVAKISRIDVLTARLDSRLGPIFRAMMSLLCFLYNSGLRSLDLSASLAALLPDPPPGGHAEGGAQGEPEESVLVAG